MCVKGKERLMWKLEMFTVTRLRPCGIWPDVYEVYDAFPDAKERLKYMNEWWHWHEYKYRTSWGELVQFPQLTNHEICHEMFWNAFRGRSKMYIQVKDMRHDEERERAFCHQSDGEDQVITLSCSLLTTQMLDYDIMMFEAMSNEEDWEYREEARRFYRPYLFSYVMELDERKYDALRELQERVAEELRWEDNESNPYLWLACTFAPDIESPDISLDGYVVQSASSINKTRAQLYIKIEDPTTSHRVAKSFLDAYKLNPSCLKDDGSFIQRLQQKLGHDRLSTIDVYKVGNGNCVYAQGESGDMSFFYDIGFHYRHRPKKIVPGRTYSYANAMKKIYAQKPSFFILSHWDMDHIAGSAAARKDFLDQDWFAPDCQDACADAQRLARYLDLKDHLLLAKRPASGMPAGRCIGKVDVVSTATLPQILATYRFYMGKKAWCDNSLPNCEGIVIEYMDQITGERVLMMGDVNYASFDKARLANHDLGFADTPIDYLIVPHHGSEHTDPERITDGKAPIKGKLAILCCTNELGENRPNQDHKDELKKRFGDNVRTTEEAPLKDDCIRICLKPSVP